jgi:general secretion pathway protein K
LCDRKVCASFPGRIVHEFSFMKTKNKRASIIVLVSWVLVFLSIFSLSLGFLVRQRLRMVQHLENREKLRFIADAGVKRAISLLKRESLAKSYDTLADPWNQSDENFRDILVGDGLFNVSYQPTGEEKFRDRDEARFGIVDEERKININLTSNPDVLKRLFQEVTDLSERESIALAESIFDWKDEDDARYQSGAESRYYESNNPPYRPKNANFGALEELLLVKGMTPSIFHKIKPFVTLYSSGLINVNTASRPIFIAAGLNKSLSDKLLRYRRGVDGTDGTRDDQYFGSSEAVVTDLNDKVGLNDNEKEQLELLVQSKVLTVQSRFFGILSEGSLKYETDQRLLILCVVERLGNIKSWYEEYVSTAS